MVDYRPMVDNIDPLAALCLVLVIGLPGVKVKLPSLSSGCQALGDWAGNTWVRMIWTWQAMWESRRSRLLIQEVMPSWKAKITWTFLL